MTHKQKNHIIEELSAGFKNKSKIYIELLHDRSVKYQFFQDVQELVSKKDIILGEFGKVDELLYCYINLCEIETYKILEKIGLSSANENRKLYYEKLYKKDYISAK